MPPVSVEQAWVNWQWRPKLAACRFEFNFWQSLAGFVVFPDAHRHDRASRYLLHIGSGGTRNIRRVAAVIHVGIVDDRGIIDDRNVGGAIDVMPGDVGPADVPVADKYPAFVRDAIFPPEGDFNAYARSHRRPSKIS